MKAPELENILSPIRTDVLKVFLGWKRRGSQGEEEEEEDLEVNL